MRHAITMGVVLATLLAVGNSIRANEPAAKKAEDKPHVMKELLDVASKREAEIRNTVRDYTCTIVKRERINGVLQEHRFINAKVRAAGVREGRKQPLAVHLFFRAPEDFAGRQVIYVEGENDGKMVVKRGGTRFKFVTTTVDPESDLAHTESLMHVRHLGFDGMVSEIVAQLREDIAADPTSTNTKVRLARNAKVNNRSCTSVVITHPRRAKGLIYHRAEFLIDNEFHLPVRVAAYDWPKEDGATPELIGEFTYTKVKINVGLTDADFDVGALRTASRPAK